MIQFIIAISGILGLILVQSKNIKLRRWAGVVGIIGQPFWIISAWGNHQTGMLILSVLYSFVWIKDIYFNWKLDE